jgi:hypothetical protein
MERILPPIRQRAIYVDLPHVASAADLRLAFDRILEAVATGKMTPGEGLALCAILKLRADMVELVEIEQDIVALKQQVNELLRR